MSERTTPGHEHAVDSTRRVARRPYVAPELHRLGSVRELTLGGTGSEEDPGGTPPNLFAQLGRRRRR